MYAALCIAKFESRINGMASYEHIISRINISLVISCCFSFSNYGHITKMFSKRPSLQEKKGD